MHLLFPSLLALHMPARLLPHQPRAATPHLQAGMNAFQLVTLIGRAPEQIGFQLVMDAIEELYDVSEVPFTVGDVTSKPGENMGSAKILSFAQLQTPQRLDEATTLQLFGEYYRVDVLANPDGNDHANIRNFMKVGWDGVSFPEGLALSPKQGS